MIIRRCTCCSGSFGTQNVGSTVAFTRAVLDCCMEKPKLQIGLAFFFMLLGGLLTKAPRVSAAPSMFTPPFLKIVLKDSPPSAAGKDASSWTKACDMLGRALTVGTGPWGYGIFKGFSCGIGSQTSGQSGASDAWILEVAPAEDGAAFTMSNATGGKESSFKAPKSKSLIEYLVHPELNDLVALRILNDLPALGLLDAKAVTQDGNVLARRAHNQVSNVTPPARMKAFQLAVVLGSVYQPTILGEIEQASGTLPSHKAEGNQDPQESAAFAWHVSPEVAGALRDGMKVWFQDLRGRGAQAPEFDSGILATIKMLDVANEKGLLAQILSGAKGFVLETASAGYVGLRYGKQIFAGNPLLRKLTLIGLVTEVRSGPLDGLRFFYDTIPRVDAVQHGVKTSIGWDRVIAGKSFSFQPVDWMKSVDITPKIGFWNFNSRVLNQNSRPDLSAVVDFDLDFAPSLAIEVGTEWRVESYFARLWYGFDGAGIATRLGTRSVSSNRSGLDLIHSFGHQFNLFGAATKPALLAFAMYESLAMSGAGELTVGSSAPRNVNVDLTLRNSFFGAGFAVSW